MNAIVGSKAVFTCDFEASNDSRISQIHWEFNGTDLVGCKRFQDMINCTVTQSSNNTNYISSTLEIYPVQADNAGQYTCYCSYDTSTLDVDGAPTIQSDRKFATLSVHVLSGDKQLLLRCVCKYNGYRFLTEFSMEAHFSHIWDSFWHRANHLATGKSDLL